MQKIEKKKTIEKIKGTKENWKKNKISFGAGPTWPPRCAAPHRGRLGWWRGPPESWVEEKESRRWGPSNHE
jgi:hypothetical protein